MIDIKNPDFSRPPGKHLFPITLQPKDPARPSQPDVSLLTPFFNTDEVFLDTVQAVLDQTLQHWEWIIVDDGSQASASITMLASISQKHPRIRVIRQPNQGPAAARNQAYQEAIGRYVCLLDSDDLIEPTYLEKCIWFLDTHSDFAFCNSYNVIFGMENYLWTAGFERGKDFLQANSGPPIAVIRRAVYDAGGGFDAAIRFGHEDWDFWLKLAAAGHWGHTLPEYLQWYRKRAEGRFEAFMKDRKAASRFERQMQVKYQQLAGRFPSPQLQPAQPFETLQHDWLIRNPVQENLTGRNLLFVIPWMVVGGADRVNLDLIEGLVQHGHRVTVCCTLATQHSWEHKFSELTADIFILPNFLRLTDFPRFLHYLIVTRQVDTVVVTASTIGYQLLPYLRTVAPQVAYVDMTHVEEPHWLNGGHPRFAAGYQDALDLNIVTTRHLATWMAGIGADRERIRVMYTGVKVPTAKVNTEAVAKIRECRGLAPSIPLIVFAGRLCAQKRPLLLAGILGELHRAGYAFQAIIIGEGELREALEAELVKQQLKEIVRLEGSVPHDSWLEILTVSDILLMPSAYEGISVALLEAMANGVVPVVAAVGGQAELVPSSAGYLIPHGEEEKAAYVAALSHLLSNAEVLDTMAQANRQHIYNTLSAEGTLRILEQVFDEAHQRIPLRVQQFTPRMASEFASLSLEYRRLSEAVDWLWNTTHSPRVQFALSQSEMPIIRLVVAVCQTAPARLLLGSALVRKVGKRVLRWLERHVAAKS